MGAKEWSYFITNEEARQADQGERWRLMQRLEEAEKLLFDEGWTTDDPWPGIIYQRGGPVARVPVETWVMMRALMRGLGEGVLRAAKERR